MACYYLQLIKIDPIDNRWKGRGLTLGATYGIKDASAGQMIFCFSGGQHLPENVMLNNFVAILDFGCKSR
jgi:hypothetical protein